MKEKTVQIPLKLFLYCYLLLADDVFEDSNGEIYQKAKKLLKSKFDAITRRNLYTTYKTAETEEEKEIARQKYLDEIGMLEDFRYSKNFNQSKNSDS